MVHPCGLFEGLFRQCQEVFDTWVDHCSFHMGWVLAVKVFRQGATIHEAEGKVPAPLSVATRYMRYLVGPLHSGPPGYVAHVSDNPRTDGAGHVMLRFGW